MKSRDRDHFRKHRESSRARAAGSCVTIARNTSANDVEADRGECPIRLSGHVMATVHNGARLESRGIVDTAQQFAVAAVGINSRGYSGPRPGHDIGPPVSRVSPYATSSPAAAHPDATTSLPPPARLLLPPLASPPPPPPRSIRQDAYKETLTVSGQWKSTGPIIVGANGAFTRVYGARSLAWVSASARDRGALLCHRKEETRREGRDSRRGRGEGGVPRQLSDPILRKGS